MQKTNAAYQILVLYVHDVVITLFQTLNSTTHNRYIRIYTSANHSQTCQTTNDVLIIQEYS